MLDVRHRAHKVGLALDRSTAPYPTGESPFAGLLGEGEAISPLSYLHGTGPAAQVAEHADELLDLGFLEFTLATERPEALEQLRAVTARRSASVMVFRSPPGTWG